MTYPTIFMSASPAQVMELAPHQLVMAGLDPKALFVKNLKYDFAKGLLRQCFTYYGVGDGKGLPFTRQDDGLAVHSRNQ